jgi:regulator of protease activity HflC (stomatin/prohibitin superfamily)
VEWIVTVLVLTPLCAFGYRRAQRARASIEARVAAGERRVPAAAVRATWAVQIGAVVVFLLFVVGYTVGASVHQIPAGHVGVVYNFGRIVGQRPDGLQLIFPWQTMYRESIQVQRHRFEDLTAFSQETQDVLVVATLNYSVSPNAVQKLLREVGPNWFDRLIEPRVVNFFKEETVKYVTVEVAPNREAIRGAVRERLARDLQQYSINVDDLLIDNIDFRPAFKQAIEQKQIATQDALREQARVEQRKNEAQQAIETARGSAEALKINADAQAQANRALSASLTEQLIQFQLVQKLSDKIQVMLLPAGQGVLLDTRSLLPAAGATR